MTTRRWARRPGRSTARAVACLALLAGATACSSGEQLEYVVAAEVRGGKAWEPLIAVEPDEIAATWGRPADPPAGYVAVLMSAGTARGPEVTAVRAVGDAWVLDVVTTPFAPECAGPAVVESVLFMLHVRADTPPEEVRMEVEERPEGC